MGRVKPASDLQMLAAKYKTDQIEQAVLDIIKKVEKVASSGGLWAIIADFDLHKDAMDILEPEFLSAGYKVIRSGDKITDSMPITRISWEL